MLAEVDQPDQVILDHRDDQPGLGDGLRRLGPERRGLNRPGLRRWQDGHAGGAVAGLEGNTHGLKRSPGGGQPGWRAPVVTDRRTVQNVSEGRAKWPGDLFIAHQWPE